MRIGELAKRSGLNASRIRFYEAHGLLSAAPRGANGYRQYGPQALLSLEIIRSAQQAGFSLDEIRPLLPQGQQGWAQEQLLTGLKRKLQDIEGLQARLSSNRAQLLSVIESIEAGAQGLPCAENAQRLMAQLRNPQAPAEGGA